jgi:hypothetical protein
MFDTNAQESRWVSVVFLQGDEADRAIGTINRRGFGAGIEYLRQWDFGDETTDAALVNGYVYDRIPAGSIDRTVVPAGSPYALTYSRAHRYVSLLRRYPSEADATAAASPRRASRVGRPVVDIWGPTRLISTPPARHTVAM